MISELKAVHKAVAKRDVLASRDWNKQPAWKILANKHRWAILKILDPKQADQVRALATKRICRDRDYYPSAMDPLRVILEMCETFALDDWLAALCLLALYNEFKNGRILEETSRLHQGAKTLNAVSDILKGQALWEPNIAKAIEEIVCEILKSSPGFWELEGAMLKLLPGSTFDKVLETMSRVANEDQIVNLWDIMLDSEVPGSTNRTKEILQKHFPDATFE